MFFFVLTPFSSASVPTDYGNVTIQRTPLDSTGNYSNWCPHVDPITSTAFKKDPLYDSNGIPYIEFRSTDNFYWDHEGNCDATDQSSIFQTPPLQSFMPDVSQGYNFYIIHTDMYDVGTTTFYDSMQWYTWDGTSVICKFDCTPSQDTDSITKELSYLGTSYRITKTTKAFGLATSTNSLVSTQNSGVIAEFEFDNQSAGYATSTIYAIIYSSTDLYNEIVTPLDLVTYLSDLNGITAPSSYNPSTYNLTAIRNIYTPYNGMNISLGSATGTLIRFYYDYINADNTYYTAAVELSNLTTGLTYVPFTSDFTTSGLGVFNEQITLPAGNYRWRAALYSLSSSTIYSSYRDFSLYGTTTTWYGSYSQTATSTYWNVSDQLFGTSSPGFGTSSVNLYFPSFGSATCGVNMSCAIPLCLSYPNICERFPFSYAADFYSIMRDFNSILQSGEPLGTLSYVIDFGTATHSVTFIDFDNPNDFMLNFGEQTRYWGALGLWFLFAFWAFRLTAKILQ